MVVSQRLATLRELQTVHSIEDCYTLLEIAQVDTYNRRIVAAYRARENANRN